MSTKDSDVVFNERSDSCVDLSRNEHSQITPDVDAFNIDNKSEGSEHVLDGCNCDETLEYRGLLECLLEFGINQTITKASLLDIMKNKKKRTKFLEDCMKGKPISIGRNSLLFWDDSQGGESKNGRVIRWALNRYYS
jgi:hypothetical protein